MDALMRYQQWNGKSHSHCSQNQSGPLAEGYPNHSQEESRIEIRPNEGTQPEQTQVGKDCYSGNDGHKHNVNHPGADGKSTLEVVTGGYGVLLFDLF